MVRIDIQSYLHLQCGFQTRNLPIEHREVCVSYTYVYETSSVSIEAHFRSSYKEYSVICHFIHIKNHSHEAEIAASLYQKKYLEVSIAPQNREREFYNYNLRAYAFYIIRFDP